MKFNCPHCGQRLECQTLAAGMQIACPACQNGLAVPATPAHPSPEPPLPAPLPSQTPHTSLAEFMAALPAGESSRPPTGDLAPTTHVLAAQRGGEYALTQNVRLGGQGAILDAKDINLRRTVALKVLRAPEKASPEQLLRFVEEAQITSQLEHPNIVPIHELGVDSQGSVFYTMKMVEGITLRDILNRIHNGDPAIIRRYPLPTLLTILQKVCDAIAFAHSRHVVHRDLKPENIMVGEYGEVLVMDWGLAKVIDPLAAPIQRLRPHAIGGPRTTRMARGPTRTTRVESVRNTSSVASVHTLSGEVMGSPGYMAPEQARGDVGGIDERTDIYALGAMLYNILTLDIPIKGNDIHKVLDDIVRGNIRDPLSYNRRRRKAGSQAPRGRRGNRGGPTEVLPHCPGGWIPESLAAVAMKAMSLDPADRYPSVKALQVDVEAYQQGFATSAEQAGLIKLLRLFVLRHRGAAAAAAALLVIVTGASIVNFQQRLKAERALHSFHTEKQERSRDRKTSAPEMVRSARMLIEQDDIPGAMAALKTAIDYDPHLADARMLLALLLLHQRDIPPALQHSREALQAKPGDRDMEEMVKICSETAMKGSHTLSGAPLAAICNRQGIPTLAAQFMSVAGHQLQSYRAKIEMVWPGSGRQLTETRDGLLALDLSTRRNVADLSRLKGIPLHHLSLRGTSATDLSPLTGMPLQTLDIASTPIETLTLSPTLPLTRLTCGGETVYATSPLADINGIRGLRLSHLAIGPCPLTDLSGLEGMPLTNLTVLAPVADLAPLKGMALSRLTLTRSTADSLEPLRGMPLTQLDLQQLPASDLEPLRGMPLTDLRLDLPRAADLSPLRGMPLTRLSLNIPGLLSLEPLRGMPLTQLSILNGQFPSLEPLEGVPLRTLNLAYAQRLADLAPLKELPLETLALANCYAIRDLSPLHGLPLRQLRLAYCPNISDLKALKGMKTLTALDSDVPSPLAEVTAALTNSLPAAATAATSVVETFGDVPVMAEAVTQARKVIEKLIPLATLAAQNPRAIPPEALAHQGLHYWIPDPAFRCTWPEARIICARLGGRLATINHESEQQWIASTLMAKSATPAWLGGTVAPPGKQWEWISREPFSFTRWDSGQPDMRIEALRRLAIKPDGRWVSHPASHRLPFIIEWDH